MNRPNLNDKLFPKYPRAIQIQTVSGCNAACITCPTGLSPQRTEHKYLPMQLWEKVVEECSQLESPIDTIIVSLFNKPLIDKRLEEVQQFVDFWSQLGAQVHVSPAWNRAGNLPSDNEYQLEATGWSGKLCPKPFVTLCITCDGTVVLCCADYAAEVVLGNLKEQKLLEIWMGSKHQSVLLQILKKQNPLCNRCDKLASFQTQKGEFLSAEPY